MRCPDCHTQMTSKSVFAGQSWHCEGCRGLLVEQATLRRHLSAATITALVGRARAAERSEARRCSACGDPFHVWSEQLGSTSVELDACPTCELLWFDEGEIAKLNSLAGSKPTAHGAQSGVDAVLPGALDPFTLLEGLGELLVGLLAP